MSTSEHTGISPLKLLADYGQSPWLDFIERRLVTSGELASMIEEWGIRGVTSNPAIFEKAIRTGAEYDEDIEHGVRAGWGAGQIYESIVVEDIRLAADVLEPVYRATGGHDGFVSLEVSPHLAHDVDGTVEEAIRLFKLVDRPNVMIKVPGTPAGYAVVPRLLLEGVNVNVTLLFSVESYRQIVSAYLTGLEERVSAGAPLETVASVASFFLSRIDTLVDQRLERLVAEGGPTARAAEPLRGEAGIANARRAYQVLEEVLASERFRKLSSRGARPQRLLWASTGTKNPSYSDVKYVEPLIGPHTINTMPLATLRAYDDHGQPAARIKNHLEEANRLPAALQAVGIDLEEVAATLLREGIRKFIEPFDASHRAIEGKMAA